MDKISNNEKLVNILLSDKKSSGNILSLKFLDSLLNPNIPSPKNFDKCPILLIHPEW